MAQKIYIGKTEVANLDKVYTKSEINTQLSTKASTQQLANALAAVEHEISDVSSDKQNKLTAGSNITISNDVISSTDTTYSAGTGLSIDANNEISVDTNTIATQLDIATVEEEINALELNKQDELVAGTGITIDGNVISSEGTTYTAGSNISIDDDVISAVDTTYEAGNGLDLTSGAFSIDTTVVATKTDLEDKQNVATLDNDVAALGFSKTHGTLTGITMNSSLVTVENGIANLGTVITDISDKQDTATLETDVAALGFTKNEGTLTGITMNGSSVSVSSGVADLGTVITDISGKQDTLTAGNNISINSNVVSIDSSTATDGQVLTADGLGGAT
ncbi:MAG: hypothetical protein J6W64_00040 [Bacilli bacterium]|nr:hypothetical protein [Bacilli bacterium]